MLLNIERVAKKPQYNMASEMPLVLHSCEFEGLRFFISAGKSALYIFFDSIENSTQVPK